MPIKQYGCYYKRYTWRWFRDLFRLDLMLRDARAFVQRGRRGWADRDIWDMCSYHAELTLQMLEYYRNNYTGYPGGMTEAEYVAKIDQAIDAWRAKKALLLDEGIEFNDDYDAWRNALDARWEAGLPAWNEIYDSLWT